MPSRRPDPAKELLTFRKRAMMIPQKATDILQKSQGYSAKEPYTFRTTATYVQELIRKRCLSTTKCSKSAMYIPQNSHNYSDILQKSHVNSAQKATYI